ncbi:hypothetical protein AB0D32_04800 [Micromonospora sp. NPDC048170]|uniref:hypothetical protein n=1 Tax=Micromonospora sp. NPDC048170 TaxID=3154819 RepID=UPI0033F7FAC1
MIVDAVSDPAKPGAENEDWFSASSRLVVVLDGATARTDTGCVHGVSWYAAHLGAAISAYAEDVARALPDALSLAIKAVAGEHPSCDLQSAGTPSSAVAILRANGEVVEYLALGDISLVFDCGDRLEVITDDRVEGTAGVERAEADKYPIGSQQKNDAMVRMKHAELAARNMPGGFWVAAADPTVAREALTGAFPLRGLRRCAVLTDGAARLVRMFDLLTWSSLLDLLAESGPAEVVSRVRAIEAKDPEGHRWPRNKRSDDATVVYMTPA